jgi:hypothetical protein
VGEGDVGVVDALVDLPERLAVLLRHVPAITLLPRVRSDGTRWPCVVVLQPGRRRQ